tara:strand:- start:616 stop:786 length:171 start_codon:yes stop_codon:yes gene_type:complete
MKRFPLPPIVPFALPTVVNAGPSENLTLYTKMICRWLYSQDNFKHFVELMIKDVYI